MFEYIKGVLVAKTDNYAVIEANGIGYKIFSTRSSLQALGDNGSVAKLYIYMHINSNSDIFSLYGFTTLEERATFEMILGVSGVGAKTAAALLSNVSTSKFALCVVTGDSKYLSSNTPGLGQKGAQRIILELKDKFKNVELSDVTSETVLENNVNGNNEAIAALVVLGYSRTDAERALKGASGTVEDMIKFGLKNLM